MDQTRLCGLTSDKIKTDYVEVKLNMGRVLQQSDLLMLKVKRNTNEMNTTPVTRVSAPSGS